MPIAQILLATTGGSGGPPPTPTYTFTPQTVSANEGSGFTFEIGGTNIVNGTYFWTIETGSSEFTTTSGSFNINNNYGVITVTPTADETTEVGAETFTVAIRSDSITGTILETSSAITINDTSFAIGGSLIINIQTRPWATTNATSPTYGAYTYPDETSGSLHTLTGTQYVLSEAWGTTATICFNLWFYPTANNKIIMAELGQAGENSGYHYSMLEINSSNYLKSRTWGQSGSVTSTGTVTLNAWNHVYFYFDNVTNTFSMSLNNETAVTQGSVNKVLSDTGYSYWGIGLVDSTNMGSGARYQGKFADLVIDTTIIGSTYTATKAKYIPPLSLVFNNPQQDYLSTPASADWNLGNNWTMEFWIKSNNNSANNINIPGGQWGLINQGGWYGGMPDDNCILVGMAGGYLTINQSANGDISFAEPTTQVWTHVAIVNNGGGSAQKVYYNGVEQTPTGANYTSNGKTNTTADLYIGRLSNQYAGYASHFDGKMALVRISNTAKYLAPFTATTTYGVEADTKLFLGLDNPLVDAKGHTITNNGVTTSASFPVTIIITNVSVNFNTRAATVDFTSTVSQSDFASVVFEWSGGAAFDGPFNLTVNPGSNTYTSPALSLAGSGNDLTTEISIGSGSQACNSNIYTGSWSVVCLVEGTMITMADGSHKAVEDVGYNDLIRVWNFDLGEFSEALPVFVKREETHGEHNRFTFSDGTVLRTVGHHVFNKQAGEFTMLVRDTTPVGTITFNEQGEEVTLISKETIQEPVRFYNVWTQYHLNLFADSILTSNRFNNIYPIQDMKFVKDNRALRPLEEFANIDPKYISGLRLQEQPAQYTAEYIRDYVESKLERLDVANIINYVHTE